MEDSNMYPANENKREMLRSVASIRILSILGGVACLIFFAPLTLIVFLLLKADGGPAFVGHKHINSDGKSSTIWRFRARSPGRPENLGEFLLRSRTEILPEIYNVAKGDISFSEMLSDI
jgi:lipopolysaccharide/colanic/teichoic acid biosynthesis glycosyltransferase